MAYMMVMGPCFCCKQPMSYNPNTVPSIPIDGVRQAICRACIEQANPKRIENGLPPVVIASDAYEAAEC